MLRSSISKKNIGEIYEIQQVSDALKKVQNELKTIYANRDKEQKALEEQESDDEVKE